MSMSYLEVCCLISKCLETSQLSFWRRKWQPTPVLLPGKSHRRRSLVRCSPQGRKESDTAERLHFHFHIDKTNFGDLELFFPFLGCCVAHHLKDLYELRNGQLLNFSKMSCMKRTFQNCNNFSN